MSTYETCTTSLPLPNAAFPAVLPDLFDQVTRFGRGSEVVQLRNKEIQVVPYHSPGGGRWGRSRRRKSFIWYHCECGQVVKRGYYMEKPAGSFLHCRSKSMQFLGSGRTQPKA